MLRYFLEKNLVYFAEKQPENWQEAVKVSCRKLIENNIATEEYAKEIIEGINTFGPYIVILPQVAMPHAATNSLGIKGTGISFTKFPKEVIFYDDNTKEEKPASLFFTLVAKDSKEHLENLSNLTTLFQNNQLLKELLQLNNIDEYVDLVKKYDELDH